MNFGTMKVANVQFEHNFPKASGLQRPKSAFQVEELATWVFVFLTPVIPFV